MTLALIIGSQGQDGRLLTETLTRRAVTVAGLSRQGLRFPDGQLGPPVDLADSQAVAELIRCTAPHVVYYLAAVHHASQDVALSNQSILWASSMSINATGPVNVLEALRQHRPQARFFYASSCLIFGPLAEPPQKETTCFRPECVYGISKTAGTHAVALYRKHYGLYAVSGILYNHESHLRPERFLSNKVVTAARRISQGKQEELVLADLSAQADWGYAPDFVEAMPAVLEASQPQDYIIATGTLHSVLDWVEEAFALAGLDWRRHVREDPSLGQRRRIALVGDTARIRAACDWRPTTSFTDMVRKMFEALGSAP
ncbi:MAG TPA: GDP-mannose 4,6-dehydratase [Solidesulfovibrio magneticus]|nr:GDP-mannose 4,6-dehydratase [Solidesulfovibrio magneticus]